MDFRTSHEWLRQRTHTFRGGTLSSAIFIAVLLMVLIPIVAIALFGVALFVLLLPLRLALARFQGASGGSFQRRGAVAPTGPWRQERNASPASGPIIDVEVTRSR